MLKFEELPPSAQAAFKRRNILRRASLFAAWIIFAVLFTVFIMADGIKNIFMDAYGAMIFGAILVGTVHGEFIFRKTIHYFPFYVAFVLILIELMCLAVIGFFLIILDTVLVIMKKPLVYPFENTLFLESANAQYEMQQQACDDIINALNSDDALTKIQKLKEMMEQGVISEEEFNAKKTELLKEV